MGNTYSKICIHFVFSTQNRAPYIRDQFEKELKSFICASAQNQQLQVLAVGGTENHLHLLINLPTSCSVSRAARLIKASSSKWLNDHYFENREFRWQRGYGAFSVNNSMVAPTIKYINRQKEHHRQKSYGEEFVAILDKHSLTYDHKRLLPE